MLFRSLESFKRVVAPFAGVITRRNVDVGDLIDAETEGQRRQAIRLYQGEAARVFEAWRGLLISAMASLEALDRPFAQSRPPHAFAGVVMFYPGCASALKRRPRFEPAVPSLMLLGALDDWTPAAPATNSRVVHVRLASRCSRCPVSFAVWPVTVIEIGTRFVLRI